MCDKKRVPFHFCGILFGILEEKAETRGEEGGCGANLIENKFRATFAVTLLIRPGSGKICAEPIGDKIKVKKKKKI